MATILDWGIPNISTGVAHPKQKHRWRVTFANMGDGSDTTALSAQCTTVTRPSLSFDEVQLDRYNSRAYVLGKYTFEPLQLTIEDDITNTASRIVQGQLQKQQALIGAGARYLPFTPAGRNYKFVTKLEQLDGAEEVLETWVLEGCMLQAVDYDSVDYAASEAVMINATIRFDHARQELAAYSDGAALGGPG